MVQCTKFSNHRHQYSHHTLVMCSNLALKYVKFVVMIAPNAQFLVWPYSSCVCIQRKNLSGPHNDGLITDQTRRNNYRLKCIISLDFKNIADIWADDFHYYWVAFVNIVSTFTIIWSPTLSRHFKYFVHVWCCYCSKLIWKQNTSNFFYQFSLGGQLNQGSINESNVLR